MADAPQFDYAKLPDGSYAKFPKGTPREAMQQKLVSAGLLKGPFGPSAAGKEQAKKSPLALTSGIEPTPGGVASWEAGELGGGVADALKGIYKMVAQPPQSETERRLSGVPAGVQLKRFLEGVAEPLTRVGEVPGAVRDLYKSGVGIPALAMQVPRTMSNLATTAALGKVAGVDAPAKQRATVRSIMTDPQAGSLLGSRTRGIEALNRVDKAAQGIPVDWQPAYQWAQKAIELGKRGFTVPKPITDFVNWVDTRMKPSIQGGIDTPGTLNPLEYQHARDFEIALGSKIPWELDSGGKMAGIMKKMRESLGKSTAEGLKPYNLDTPYLRGKAEFEKAYGAKDKFGPLGYVGGKMAGYGVSTFTGHPLLTGYAGGKAGESLAGSLVRSVTNAGGKE